MANKKLLKRLKVKRRVRKKVFGTAETPRMSVFRSNKEIYVQLIDDINGATLLSASSRDGELKSGAESKIDVAAQVGKALAEKATANGIENVVFDRNGYLYHGRVKSLAEGAREGGLKF
jgi:large subunit ribosomal protein L18